MSLFRKPKRAIQKRVVKFESEDEEDSSAQENGQKTKNGNNTVGSTSTAGLGLSAALAATTSSSSTSNNKVNAKEKNKVKKENASRQSVLSFENEDDEDGSEVFKVKKSSQSRRLSKMLEKERKKQREKTKENADEEQVATFDDHQPTESQILFQKKDVGNDGGEMVEIIAMTSADEDEDDDQASHQDSFRKILESGAIPDAAMIHAARKRRQMAREMGDFIQIDDTERYEGSNSRLVRDDDNDRSDDDDDDDDEEGGRISFAVNTAARDREKVREAIMSANRPRGSDSGDEEVDEELKRWEDEQIRKGVSIPQIQSQSPEQTVLQDGNHYYTQGYFSSMCQSSPAVISVPSVSSGPAGFSSVDSNVAGVEQKVSWKMAAIPAGLDRQPPTLEMVRQRLQERFVSLGEVHRAHQRELEKISSQVDDSELRVHTLGKELPDLANSFTFYQEMRGYVTDLVECLDEKVVQINSLETAMMNLLKQRSGRFMNRRQQDIKDQAEEFTKLASKAMGSQTTELINRDKSSTEDAAKMRRIAEREGRRSRRRRCRESKISEVKHYEGMSSDDEEMESDTARFLAERDRILRESACIFDDVEEDFSSLKHIKKRFEDWKRRFPSSYNEAYIYLCLPKICNPFVRLQLIGWDPLKDGRSFEDMKFYEDLMFFGFDETASLDSLRRDTDVNLVPMVVERVVIPKITDIVENVWDPMSNSQTLRLVRLTKKLVDEYPTLSGDSKKLTCLLKAVVARIKQTFDEDVYVPLYPKALLENTSVGANAFFQRQFWSCVKLLHNILSWQGILADGLLQELALNCLLNRYILLALQSFPGGFDAEKCHMITSVLPRSWFTQLNGEHTLPQLEMFCRYLKTAASNLDKVTSTVTAGFLAPKVDPKDSLKDIIKILATVRAMDHALSLATQFSLKDLKSLIAPS